MTKWREIIQELLDKNELQVIEVPYQEVDGMLLGNSIVIKEGLLQKRKEFVILHEIGHYELHRGTGSERGKSKKKETEANAFAAVHSLSDCEENLEEVSIIDLLVRCGALPHEAEQLYYNGSLEKIRNNKKFEKYSER